MIDEGMPTLRICIVVGIRGREPVPVADHEIAERAVWYRISSAGYVQRRILYARLRPFEDEPLVGLLSRQRVAPDGADDAPGGGRRPVRHRVGGSRIVEFR